MVDVNSLAKITEFEVQLRKPYPELPEIIETANKMLLKSNSCLLCYETEKRIFKIKVYRCRQSFSSLVIAAVAKNVPKDIHKLLTISNMVDSNHGFIQFLVKDSIDNGYRISGQILKICLYAPKDPANARILGQRLLTI